MLLRKLVGESLRAAFASRAVAALIVVLSCTVPALILSTSGATLEAERELVSAIDREGAKVFTITTTSTTGLGSDVPARIARLSSVSWVVGLGPSSDTGEGILQPTGRVPAREVQNFRGPIEFRSSGEPSGAFVSAESVDALGLTFPEGQLAPGHENVIGWFIASSPLVELNHDVLFTAADVDKGPVERIVVDVEAEQGKRQPTADLTENLDQQGLLAHQQRRKLRPPGRNIRKDERLHERAVGHRTGVRDEVGFDEAGRRVAPV